MVGGAVHKEKEEQKSVRQGERQYSLGMVYIDALLGEKFWSDQLLSMQRPSALREGVKNILRGGGGPRF